MVMMMMVMMMVMMMMMMMMMMTMMVLMAEKELSRSNGIHQRSSTKKVFEGNVKINVLGTSRQLA